MYTSGEDCVVALRLLHDLFTSREESYVYRRCCWDKAALSRSLTAVRVGLKLRQNHIHADGSVERGLSL